MELGQAAEHLFPCLDFIRVVGKIGKVVTMSSKGRKFRPGIVYLTLPQRFSALCRGGDKLSVKFCIGRHEEPSYRNLTQFHMQEMEIPTLISTILENQAELMKEDESPGKRTSSSSKERISKSWNESTVD